MSSVALAILEDDLLVGADPEGNGPWLARLLSSRGWSVRTLQFLPDTVESLRDFLKTWSGRADQLVVSWGTLEQGAGNLLSAVDDLLQAPFATEGKMEDFAGAGGKLLSVPGSVATGLSFSVKGSRILILPGEPALFRSLSGAEFCGEAAWRDPGPVRVVGLSPGQVRERLLQASYHHGSISMSCSPNMVTLRPRGPEAKDPESLISLRTLFEGDCLSPGADSLAQAVLQESIRAGVSIAAAESCTGGLIGAELTGPPGASASFLGSAVCYANEAKKDILGVPLSVLETSGAVSEACALAMARGARQLYRADLAVSVTGVAGPDGGSPLKPVGTVWFGVSSGHGDRAFLRRFRDMDRNGVRMWTVAVALESLWRHLRGGETL